MISIEEYKENPCGVLSIPYWKAKSMTVPANMKIIHSSEFDENLLENYDDKTYFRLKHNLNNIPIFDAEEFKFETISLNKMDELADMINRSYSHSEICVSNNYIKSLTDTEVYCRELWIGAFCSEKLIGSILCDFDAEVGEAIIEWLQVLPEYRNRGIASALISKVLIKMSDFADFATVSGECNNITNPEKVYRKCGFFGNDVWHILNSKI